MGYNIHDIKNVLEIIQIREESIIEKLNDGIFGTMAGFFDNVLTWCTILSIIILCIFGLRAIARYAKRINDKSKEKISKLEEDGKYIRGLYVELNDSKENLRYFLYRNKWKKRIIQDFNQVFNDEYGYLLKEVFNENKEISFSLKKHSSIDNIIKTIEQTRVFLNDVHEDKVEYSSKYKDSMILFQFYSNKYDGILLQLQKRAKYIKSKYIILSGSAGNGKTNLLCSFSELLFSLNYPCVFMNAKDIENDVEKYYEEQLNFFKIVHDNKKCMLGVEKLSELMLIPTYVIIDAVNENSNQEFLEKLPTFLNRILDKRNIRVIISCRSEYYETRYKKILQENVKHTALYDNIQDQKYSRNAINRMFDNYSNRFDFKGKMSPFVRSKLSQELLLMRMFFETNVGSKQIFNDLDYYKLYETYINQIRRQKQVDIETLLDEVTGIMTDKHDYSFVPEKQISEKSKQIYEKVDGMILMSKTLIHHENSILENEESVIYFVFDEVRDYCIARYNLMKMCKDKDVFPEKEQVMQFLEGLFQEQAICFEGVVNYVYKDYKSRKEEQLCCELMEHFIKPADILSKGKNYMSNEPLRGWGLRLIFQNNQKLLACEEEYLKYIVYENPGDLLSSLFSFLVSQEIEQGPYTLEILFQLIKNIHSQRIFCKVIKNCVDSFGRDCISHSDFAEIDKKMHDVSKEALDRFRHFEIIFIMFFEWEGKKQLIDQLKKDCDIKAMKREIKNQYYFESEETGYDN